jgi:hypothetical protein
MFWLIPIVGAIAAFLYSLWQKLPKDIKLAIIESIISTFVDLFKKYYQYYTNRNKKND